MGDWRILLKRILNRVTDCGLGSFVHKVRTAGGWCEHCNEHSGSVSGRKFLDSLTRRIILRGVS
jgi:hypothetical protein